MSQRDAPEPIGRKEELARLEEFLNLVPDGRAGLLIEGPSGMGKTALWTAAVDLARTRGYRVLVSRPAPADAELSFAALGDLLETVEPAQLAEMPEPQRRAVDVALRRADPAGEPGDPLALGLGVRAILRMLSEASPVLVAVDDMPWLDANSRQTLEYAFRRLESDAIGLLGSTPSISDESVSWTQRAFPEGRLLPIRIDGLPVEEFTRVVRSRVDADLPRHLVARIHRASAGIPLHGIELARALVAEGALPGPEDPLPVPTDLRRLLKDRLEAIPEPARTVLAAAALSPDPTVDLLQRLEGISDGLAASLAIAVEAGVIDVEEGRIRFTHPLFAIVVGSDLPAEQTRHLHTLLGDGASDPEERARHRALGADGPDEEVAAELEEVARSVRLRGAPSVAAELSEHAWRLTPADHMDDARRRAIASAEYHLDGGDARRSRLLLEELTATLPPGRLKAVALQRLGWARYHDDSWAAASRLFEEARTDAGEDPGLGASISLDASLASLLAGNVQDAAENARHALEQARSEGDESLIAEASAVAGSIDFLTGSGLPGELMDRAVAMETWRRPRPTMKQPSVALGILLKWSDDYERGLSLLSSAHRRMVEAGNERSLPFILFHLAELECWMGDWVLAEEHAELGVRVASDIEHEAGVAFCLYARALMHALRGRLDEARRDGAEGLARADRSGAAPARVLHRSILGFVEVSLGEFDRASEHLGPLADEASEVGIFEPGVHRYLGDAIETLIATEREEEAAALIEQLESRSREVDRPWGMAVGARCRGVLFSTRGDQAAASAALKEALAHHDRFSHPFERARTELVFGMVLRRDRRKKLAREALGRALEGFETLGAPLWADRTRAEMARIGGRAPSSVELTPTEEQVARLAAEGAKNQEIADALFLSTRTVEWNLSNIYRKLGVRSRTELARWLSARS